MIKKIVVLIGLMVVFSSWVVKARAAEQSAALSYHVEPIFPNNQLGQHQSYFDLDMTNIHAQTLSISIHNNEPKEVTVKLAAHVARTSANGQLDYSGNQDNQLAKSLPLHFEEIISVPEIVTIPAKSGKEVTVQIDLSDTRFVGDILGGLYFQEVRQHDTAPIKNEYSYVLGIKLKGTDTVNPHFDLDEVDFVTDTVRGTIKTAIINTQSLVLSKYHLSERLVNTLTNDIIELTDNRVVSFAPHSQLSVSHSVMMSKLKAGSYIYELAISSDSGEEAWELTKRFTVGGKPLQPQQTIIPPASRFQLLVLGGLMMTIVLLLVFIKRGGKPNDS